MINYPVYTPDKTQYGFTLIEVLIAMAIFAILSLLAYGGLNQAIISKERTAASLARLQELQITMTKIQRDFSQITSRTMRDEMGTQHPGLTAQQGNEFLIQLTRNGWRNPAKTTRGHLQRVAYRMDEDKLLRIHWPFVDRAVDDQGVETQLISNLKDVKLRFLNDQNEWHDSWPALNAEPENNNTLPVAIEVTLEMEDWGNMVRVIRTTG
ncbi:MAG: type II secretion system minor pseudopilin GspJ [Gammaproteobacteria bacterium]|nr:type II secretion system minor pseudopilin GspJ [Gammaproteobacteria bacterium]